jgi:type II secretion system protein I
MTLAGGRRGFTVIEVMAAVVILSITILSLLRANNQTLQLKTSAQNITLATLLAQEKLSEIQIDPTTIEESAEGDFGERFPYWRWTLTNEEVEIPFDFDALEEPESPTATRPAPGAQAARRQTSQQPEENPPVQKMTLTIFWPEGIGEGSFTINEYLSNVVPGEGDAAEEGSSRLSSPATGGEGGSSAEP